MTRTATREPLGMLPWPQIAGALQRGMFALAYLWFGYETAISVERPAERTTGTHGLEAAARSG